MSERLLSGLAASPGLATGPARVLDAAGLENGGVVPEAERGAEAERAVAALAAAGDQITTLASVLESDGRSAEAEIVATGALMAADPSLAMSVRSAVEDDGLRARAALLHATAYYADTLAAIDDPVLRLRADDVRSLGRRAARLANGSNGHAPDDESGASVLVARDLGPADVAELGQSVRAVALADGGVMAHAAIVARSLGIPMVVGVGDEIFEVADGAPLVVDGGDGTVALSPDPERCRRAEGAAEQRRRERERSAAARLLPAETADGHRLRVLVNVASATEVNVGIGAGAEGVGLFRTELRFLDATSWPTENEHRAHVEPVLKALSGATATVRLLDFGGDKTPPFLAGTSERGIGLLLAHPAALVAQVRGILAAAGQADLRLLLPMVERAEQVCAIRDLVGDADVALGAMVETVEAVERVSEIAAAADFLSIGTNDLTHSVLATDRFAPGEAFTHHPKVLEAIAHTIVQAERHGRIVEICGEAASDRVTMPLLLGLGTAELSVGAARVGNVRAWVRALRFDDVRSLAQRALELSSAYEVAELVRPVSELLAKLGDATGERVQRSAGVVALGGQP